jgi:hypothetical protein
MLGLAWFYSSESRLFNELRQENKKIPVSGSSPPASRKMRVRICPHEKRIPLILIFAKILRALIALAFGPWHFGSELADRERADGRGGIFRLAARDRAAERRATAGGFGGSGADPTFRARPAKRGGLARHPGLYQENIAILVARDRRGAAAGPLPLLRAKPGFPL